MRCKNKKERDWLSGAGVCFRLYLDFAVPRRAQSILQMSKSGCGSTSGKCGSERCYQADGDFDGLGVRAKHLQQRYLKQALCIASSAGDEGANLGGVNQNHLSMLAAWLGGPPTHPTATIRGQMFAFISVSFAQSFEVLSAPMSAESAQKRQRGGNGKCIGRS